MHVMEQGCALSPVEKENVRQRMDPGKLDSLLNYKSSSHIMKDLPFGQRKIQTS